MFVVTTREFNTNVILPFNTFNLTDERLEVMNKIYSLSILFITVKYWKKELAETKLYHSEKKSTNILLLNQHKKEEERVRNCKIEIKRECYKLKPILGIETGRK